VLTGDKFTARVAGRMLDFFWASAPWQRRLWNVSAVMALDEVVEASEAVRDRALGQASLDWFRESLRGRIGRDPGIGGDAQRVALQDALKTKLAAGGEGHRIVRQIAADAGSNYLARWRDVLALPNHGQQPERVSRALASHLLDTGISQDHLHRWLTYLCQHDATHHDVSAIAEHARILSELRPKRFRVLVLFESSFPRGVTLPDEVLTREATNRWIADRGFADLAGNVEHHGGLLLRVKASDPEAAVEIAGDIADGIAARSAVGARNELRLYSVCLVAGRTSRRYQLRKRRRVDVRALERQDRLTDDLYGVSTSPVDSALRLLSHLDASSPETAVAGGWSAIESLLSAPGDDEGNVLAAGRLAALVACAWPRAETTTLAWRRIEAIQDVLSAQLTAAETNEAKAAIVIAEIRGGRWLQLPDPGDEAAERRMSKLVSNPVAVLSDVQAHAEVAFRRFYRQRNLVLHGGRTNAVALRASLRTVAPLVGAGMDRIVHAHLVAGLHPLDLAARARLEIARAGSADGSELAALLE
jgi:hypothetical protein